MDFATPTAHQEVRDRAREFARREIAPSAEARDRDRRWDPGLFQRLGEAGLLGAPFPAEHGGGGLDPQALCALQEGFGAGAEDAGLALAWGAHLHLAGTPIWLLGTPAQRRRYLPGICSGQSIAALAHEEDPVAGQAVAVLTAAVRRGDRWVLRGTKRQVINGPVAHLFLVTAVTDAARGPAGVSSFLVERNIPGLTVGDPQETFGLRTALRGEVRLDDCEISEDSRLAGEGEGLVRTLAVARRQEDALSLAPWIGLLGGLLDRCLAAARENLWLGQLVSRSQAARAQLANMKIRWEVTRRLQARAAWQLACGGERPERDAAILRLTLLDHAAAITRDAVELLHQPGRDADGLAQRLHRDALALATLGRGTAALRAVIAGALLGMG